MASGTVWDVDSDVLTLRCVFNRGKFYHRTLTGALRAQTRSRKPVSLRSRGPADAAWQHFIVYLDPVTGDEVALVQQYEREDGSIGASGLPDPKWVVRAGRRYKEARGDLVNRKPWLALPRDSMEQRRYFCRRRLQCWLRGV